MVTGSFLEAVPSKIFLASASAKDSIMASIVSRNDTIVKRIITFKETGVAAYVADEMAPMTCVSRGAGRALENYAIIRRSIGEL